MSARFIILGLLSTALAAPVFPSGDANTDCAFATATGAGIHARAQGTGYAHHHHKCVAKAAGSGSVTMEAIPTESATTIEAVAAATDSSAYSTTTTQESIVYVTASAVADAESTIYASSIMPVSSAPAAVSSLTLQGARFTNTKVASSAAAIVSSVVAPVASAVAVVPTTYAATSAAATSTSAPASSGGKRGVAYNSATLAGKFIGGKNIGWAYNWVSSSQNLASGITFMPMLWGTASSFTTSWVSDATKAIAAGATAVLGFNEPDHPQQANLSPSDAAAGYQKYITSNFAGKATLVSPAVTNGGAPMGLTWLSSFMSACSGCQIDAVAIHWYDSSSNFAYFKQHVTDAHTQTGKNVWLTEFGTTDGNDDTFLKQALPWLDSQSFVTKYAYFMASDGKLISGTSLSTAGTTYTS